MTKELSIKQDNKDRIQYFCFYIRTTEVLGGNNKLCCDDEYVLFLMLFCCLRTRGRNKFLSLSFFSSTECICERGTNDTINTNSEYNIKKMHEEILSKRKIGRYIFDHLKKIGKNISERTGNTKNWTWLARYSSQLHNFFFKEISFPSLEEVVLSCYHF